MNRILHTAYLAHFARLQLTAMKRCWQLALLADL